MCWQFLEETTSPMVLKLPAISIIIEVAVCGQNYIALM